MKAAPYKIRHSEESVINRYRLSPYQVLGVNVANLSRLARSPQNSMIDSAVANHEQKTSTQTDPSRGHAYVDRLRCVAVKKLFRNWYQLL